MNVVAKSRILTSSLAFLLLSNFQMVHAEGTDSDSSREQTQQLSGDDYEESDSELDESPPLIFFPMRYENIWEIAHGNSVVKAKLLLEDNIQPLSTSLLPQEAGLILSGHWGRNHAHDEKFRAIVFTTEFNDILEIALAVKKEVYHNKPKPNPGSLNHRMRFILLKFLEEVETTGQDLDETTIAQKNEVISFFFSDNFDPEHRINRQNYSSDVCYYYPFLPRVIRTPDRRGFFSTIKAVLNMN